MAKKILLIAIGLLLIGGAAIAKQQETQAQKVVYIVRAGDTPWTIAELLSDKYKDRRDLREILYFAEGLNHKFIHPGDKIIFNLEVPK